FTVSNGASSSMFIALLLAEIGVRADKHVAASVIEDHLIEIDAARAADRTWLAEFLHLEGVVFEIEAYDLGVRRDRVDALFAASAKELQSFRHVHLRIVELRDRRRVHDVTVLDLDRVSIGLGDIAVTGDVLV